MSVLLHCNADQALFPFAVLSKKSLGKILLPTSCRMQHQHIQSIQFRIMLLCFGLHQVFGYSHQLVANFVCLLDRWCTVSLNRNKDVCHEIQNNELKTAKVQRLWQKTNKNNPIPDAVLYHHINGCVRVMTLKPFISVSQIKIQEQWKANY